MIRGDLTERIEQIRVFLDLLEAGGWRLDKFVVVDEDQESLVVRLAVRHEPEKDGDIL